MLLHHGDRPKAPGDDGPVEPSCCGPSLQRMCLHLQQSDAIIRYGPGNEIQLPAAHSRLPSLNKDMKSP